MCYLLVVVAPKTGVDHQDYMHQDKPQCLYGKIGMGIINQCGITWNGNYLDSFQRRSTT